MSLLSSRDLSLAFGADVLFDGASFSIGPHDRIGLVGPNGTGKSTLLRILAGERAPDGGTLVFRRGSRIGYLPQDVSSLPEGTIVEAVLSSVPGRDALEGRLVATEAALAEAGADEERLELSEALAELHDELSHFEERFGRHRAERILGGLGFAPDRLDRPTRTLSGGWRMRAALAGLLLQDPDLLLLDEPTNHLDVPTLAWFEDFLRGTRKAMVLVSHDRLFLNRQIERVLSLEPEGVKSWVGDYDDYRRLRAEEEEQLVARAARIDARRAQLSRFIERFGAKNTKATQAKSKQKMLDRMETVELAEERDVAAFRFPDAPRSGREVLRLEGLSRAYGAVTVYRGLDAQVLRGERIAVIGPNGAGKSTLLKLAAGELAPDSGTVKLGHGVLAGYYAQHHFEKDEHAGADGAGPHLRHPRPRPHRAADPLGRGPRPGRVVDPERGRLLPLLRRRGGQAGRASSPAGSAPGWRWPSSCSAPPTSCCSTSPPTTSTSSPPRRSSRPWPATAGRSSSSPTTAAS